MNIEPNILFRFIKLSLDPPLDVRLIDMNGCTTVIRADVAEISEISTQDKELSADGSKSGRVLCCLTFSKELSTNLSVSG